MWGTTGRMLRPGSGRAPGLASRNRNEWSRPTEVVADSTDATTVGQFTPKFSTGGSITQYRGYRKYGMGDECIITIGDAGPEVRASNFGLWPLGAITRGYAADFLPQRGGSS